MFSFGKDVISISTVILRNKKLKLTCGSQLFNPNINSFQRFGLLFAAVFFTVTFFLETGFTISVSAGKSAAGELGESGTSSLASSASKSVTSNEKENSTFKQHMKFHLLLSPAYEFLFKHQAWLFGNI